MLREFQEEIARLKSQLTNRQKSAAGDMRRRKSARRRMNESTDSVASSMTSSAETAMTSSVEDGATAPGSMTTSAIDDMEARLAIERELLEADTGMLSNEKEKLLSQLSAKETALKSERENRQRMVARISALESKLLCGEFYIIVIAQRHTQSYP